MWVPRAAAVVLVVMVCTAVGNVNPWPRTILQEQGYQGVVVAVSPSIPESYAQQLILAIKAAVTEASEALFTATHRQLYFADVKILVPRTWNNVTIDEPATVQKFQDSEVHLDVVNPVYGDQPYTVQPGGCGAPGRYIHITPQYLLNDVAQTWGNTGKLLAGEWARLRWGVFDEIGYPYDPMFPLFYWGNNGEELFITPNHCADQDIDGELIDVNTHGQCKYINGLPDENCRFVPDAGQQATTSLMSFTGIDNVEHFCSSDGGNIRQHDPLAPTRQNLLCEGRPVWQVMMQHSDFNHTTQLPENHNVTPKFTVVREEEARYTLVLDHSGSMDSYNRMENMQRAAKRWILHDLSEGSWVAVVNFGSYSSLVLSLTQITNDTSRQLIAAAINDDSMGSTCVGCGLRQAVQLMGNLNNKVIMLITDGEENSSPTINDVMDEVVESGTRVITIAYGSSSEEKLELLAQKTGGKAYIVYDNDDGSMMDDAFQGSLTYQPGDSLVNTSIKIYEYDYDVTNETALKETFTIDESVGRNMQFRMETIDPTVVKSNPVLISPNGDLYNVSDYDTITNLWIINIDLAESGLWVWNVELNRHAANAHFQSVVTAQAKDPEVLPIYTESWISTGVDYVDASVTRVVVYARVTQGDSPVVGARVRAYVTTPDTTDAAVELDLLDNGQAADVQAGDGVYSRYFTQFKQEGRYAVKAQVWSDGNSFINNGFLGSRRSQAMANYHIKHRAHFSPLALSALAARGSTDIPTRCCGSVVPFDPDQATPTGNFTRTAVAGSFNVIKLPLNGDSFPPARVMDLAVGWDLDQNLALLWTAPGDDLDQGTVSGYEVRMSHHQEDLLEDTFNNGGNTTIILDMSDSQHVTEIMVEAGEEAVYTLGIKLVKDQLYYFALRAVDDVDNYSPVSNMAATMVEKTNGGDSGGGDLSGLIVVGCLLLLGAGV